MTKFRLKKPEPKESEIQSAICEYLRLRRHFFWRSNNAPIWSPDGRGGGYFRAMSKYAIKGLPDIQIITDGGFTVFLEVKRPSGKQSPDQKEFQRRCEEKGCEYYVVKSVDELQELGL
jgi:hypothetical protein